VGLALSAIVIRWLLSGIVPESWFAAFARWCEIGINLIVAAVVLGAAYIAFPVVTSR
jgi:uncharacterized membrane protein